MTDLFIVTGTSGTEKSTITPLLRKSLPEGFKVYDWDEIVGPYDNTGDIWVNNVTKEMFRKVVENRGQGLRTVVLGLIRPIWIRFNLEKYGVGEVKFCLLNITREERERRLKQRPNLHSYLIGDLEELEGLPGWIKDSGFESVTVDTTDITPEEVTEKVEEWIINDQ